MKKILAFALIFCLLSSCVLANEYPDLKPIRHGYRAVPLRERLIWLAQSQVDYEAAYNGSTIFHHLLYPNLKRTDYKYDVPWTGVFLAWIFKMAGIYTPTYANYLAYSKPTLMNRFMTAGNTDSELAYAFFDHTYLYDARPGDLVFLDRKRSDKQDYENLDTKMTISQIALITRKVDGTLTVIGGNFQGKVWEGDLSTKNNLHNPYKIMGFGVLDAKPSKELDEGLPTPLIAYEKNTGRKMILYYIYKDGTALTSNGERKVSDFLLSTSGENKKMSRKMRSTLYTTPTDKAKFGQLPDMTEMLLLGEESGRTQIVIPWQLMDGKSEFPIYTTAWIDWPTKE